MTRPNEQRAPINLAELERLAKAAQGYYGFTVDGLMRYADMARAPAEFIHAVSPDVVLRLVAALEALDRECRPCAGTGFEAEPRVNGGQDSVESTCEKCGGSGRVQP